MKYFIKTYGCQMNESDSERIAAFLEKHEYKSAKNMERADLIVVNACSVRQTAIDRIFGLKPKILKLKTINPKLRTILTGCVLKSDKSKFEQFFDAVLNINEFFKYHKFSDRTKNGKNYLGIRPKYLYPTSAFVPIMTGCDNFCSYCVVPYARGQETSRPAQEVINEVRDLIKLGYKEMTLLGQNVNSYKSQILNTKSQTNPNDKNLKFKTIGFSNLLQMINKIPGDFQIKFLTSHPKDMSDKLIDTIAKCKKAAKEIHLPVQSGDDKILKKMNRGYTAKQYRNLIKKIRQKIPNVKISTDVIVGFPGETRKQFQNTVKLFKEIKFDKAYIAKYSSRPGTSAAKLKDNVSWQEKKRRWNVLNDIINNKKLIVIVGPTASGKSKLAIKIAKKSNGEIISADSRQIYKEMDIGTGKITKKQMQRIAHYLLDVASPKKQITVAEYRKKALEAIDKIYKKGKIPILCGGTGFYIQAIIEGLVIPKVKPDWKLRKELEKKTTEELFKKLKKLDPRRAKNIDAKNRRRLIRALEIVLRTGKPIPSLKKQTQFNALYLGIKKSSQEMKKLIDKRIDKMIKRGLKKEIESLVKKYGWATVLKNTIGYKEWYPYMKTHQKSRFIGTFRQTHPLAELTAGIKLHTYQFAKRQMTWFKQNKKIKWVRDYKQAEKLVKEFLK